MLSVSNSATQIAPSVKEDKTEARPPRGIISGYVFKLARESAGLTQQDLADQLVITRATVQGWESARRPLGALSVHQSLALRNHLTARGASPGLVNLLEIAVDADHHLSQILRAACESDAVDIPSVGSVVLTHTLTELLTWPVTCVPPQAVARVTGHSVGRRGPVPSGPQLSAGQRRDFFTGLHRIVHRACSSVDGDRRILAHRQGCYLTSVDQTGASMAQIGAGGLVDPHIGEWTPRWADVRSQVVALARRGDPEPLRGFIDAGADDPQIELANLNYHAYWVGEIPDRQYTDGFMVDPHIGWHGVRLLCHLTDRLSIDHGFVDLNVHTLWLLFASRAGLGHDSPAVARSLARKSDLLLSEDRLSRRSRRELSDLLFSLRAMGMTA